MSDIETYDARVRAIRAYNQPLLDDFEAWLERSGLSEKTVETHVDNINFFTNYLVYYEPLKKLDEATSGDVWMFLVDWFPRKALWASVTSVRYYLASFKKFFRWMGETGHVSPETVTDVLDTLKEGRDEFLWDYEGLGTTPFHYREMIARLFAAHGFVEYLTSEPNIRMDPANILVARLGNHLDHESMKRFFQRLLQSETLPGL